MLTLYLSLFTLNFIKVLISGELISKSTIEICTNDGESELNCKEKIILALSIENGKLSETDYYEVYLNSVNDSNNQKRTLQYPYKILISKTPVVAVYPGTYLQDFNYHAKERVVKSDIFTCNDKDQNENPTCGWQYDDDGNKIPNSQGFCCKCTFGQIIGINPNIRGNACRLFNFGTGSAAAHCLSFDSLWFSGFELKQYQMDYKITIKVIGRNEASSDYEVESMKLSPSNQISKSESGNIIARTIGDFLPSTLPEDYSNSYLLIPSYPKNHIMVREGILNWMKVRYDQTSFDGNECDKIGTSYYAFRTHGGSDRCEIVINSCLANQLYDLYESDIDKITKNENPKYLLSQDKTKQYSFYSFNSTYKTFSYTLKGAFSSLIQLEIKADDIKYVQNIANGAIDFVIISDFEAMSSDGLMIVQVTNIGSVTSLFYLSYECNADIIPLLSDAVSIAPMRSNQIKKSVYTVSTDKTINECLVQLKNAVGDVVDSFSVQFNTTETEPDNNQGGNNNTNGDNADDESKKNFTCMDYCTHVFSFPCFVVHGCWWYIAAGILILLLIAIALIFIVKCFTTGFICRCINKILKPKKSKKKKKEKDNDKDEAEAEANDDDNYTNNKIKKNKNKDTNKKKKAHSRVNSNQDIYYI